jgi:hypothetical protein
VAQEYENFKEKIASLMVYFGMKLPPEVFDIYWDQLKDLSTHKFDSACQKILSDFIPTSTNPFPLVSHFKKYCGESGDDKAHNAIAMLKRGIRKVGQYQSVDFKDRALHYAVNAFGGWTAICCWTDKEWDINEGRLLQTYKSAMKSNLGDDCHLQGLIEMDGGKFKIFIPKESKNLVADRTHTPDTLLEEMRANKRKQINKVDGIIDGCLPDRG